MIPAQNVEEVIQNLGDGIVALFLQAVQCDFRDEHGHELTMNKAMLDLKNILEDTMRFRHEKMGYSDPGNP